MRTARGVAEQVEVSTSVIPAETENFRRQVLAFLRQNMTADAGFMAAFRARAGDGPDGRRGARTNHPADGVVSVYANGNHLGGGTYSPAGTNPALFEQLGRTRGQAAGSLGNAQLVAHWPRSP